MLAEVGSDKQRRNVNTTVVFGSDRMRVRQYQSLTAPSRDESRSGRYWASIVVVDAAIADAFVTQARQGIAIMPEHDVEIVYNLEPDYDGFIPRDDFADSSYDVMPGFQPCWRRRFPPPQRRSINGVVLDEGHLADVVAELPKFTTIEYEALNLEHALDRIGVLDVVYPTFVRAEFRADEKGVRYTLDDSQAWLLQLGTPSLAMEFGQLGMLVCARTIVPKQAELVEIDPPQSVRHWLSASGILLDASKGTFIRSVQVEFGIARPNVSVAIGGSTADISASPRDIQHIQAGKSQPLPNVFHPRHLAALWRGQMAQRVRYAERVFDGSNDAHCRAAGLDLLSRMIRAEAISAEKKMVVRVVDPFGVDVEALKAMIPLAAGVPKGELWLLSDNSPPPPKSLLDFIRREIRKIIARVRKTSTQVILDEQFVRVATAIARQLNVKIHWYKPTVPLHDRFLAVNHRAWHVGHSYNRFGCDLSAMVELRDLEERSRLRRVFDEQFISDNLAETFG